MSYIQQLVIFSKGLIAVGTNDLKGLFLGCSQPAIVIAGLATGLHEDI